MIGHDENSLYYENDNPYESLAGTLVLRAVHNIRNHVNENNEWAFLYSRVGIICLSALCDDPHAFLLRVKKLLCQCQ